jgi:uncharacterized membrane-anchored protein
MSVKNGSNLKELEALSNVRLILSIVSLTAGVIALLSRNGVLQFLTEFEYKTLAVTAIVGGLAVIIGRSFTAGTDRK